MRARTDASLGRYRVFYTRARRGPGWALMQRRKMPGPETDIESLSGDLESIGADFREAIRHLDDEIAAGDRQP